MKLILFFLENCKTHEFYLILGISKNDAGSTDDR